MKFSILRVDEVLPNLRLRSLHNPEKKERGQDRRPILEMLMVAIDFSEVQFET